MTIIEIMTFGANWYLAGQNAKLSIDWGYNFDKTLTGNVGGSGYTNWLNSSMRNEWVLPHSAAALLLICTAT